MLDTIETTIQTRGLFGPATPVVLMVSGGSDSTALAYLMADFHKRGLVGALAMLHVNHKLRGESADDDQHFVEALAAHLGIPLFACEVDVAAVAEEQGGNIEAIGRNERYLAAYDALESLCRHEALPLSEGRIVTAHTQNDRVENFYMRSIAGTGPGGFRSMLYDNGPIVRPLLDVSRENLRDYLMALPEDAVVTDAQGGRWREDATNAHTDRFRAFVRHEIIPVAKQRNSQLLNTLCRTMNLIADEDDFMEELATKVATEQVEWLDAEDIASAAHAAAPKPVEQGAGEEAPVAPVACRLAPGLGNEPVVLRRRVVLAALELLLPPDARIEAATIEAVLEAFDENGTPKSGFVTNIQGNLALSANKHGVLIEPMETFRARRKPNAH